VKCRLKNAHGEEVEAVFKEADLETL
jgi:hypothetical protein